jgi:hypothetical protein
MQLSEAVCACDCALSCQLQAVKTSIFACTCLTTQLQLQDTQRSAPAAVHYKLCCTCSGPSADLHMVSLEK